MQRFTLCALVLVAPILGGRLVSAQESPQQQPSDAPSDESSVAEEVREVVVTSTRVVRDGYSAPTPETIVGVEEIQQQAAPNIAEFVNTLPAFAGSQTPQNSQASISNGAFGVNALNLRNLGSNRTLVLLDGQRSVASLITNVVDVSTFPQQLVSRVDVVTGGASAAYGSDALSGVVNFTIDKDFTGFKGEISGGGVTESWENENWKVALAQGISFNDSRGHVLLSGEMSRKDGILQADRDWNKEGWAIMINPAYTPTNGQPQRLLLPQVSISNATLGGIITAGPLRGTAFGEGGVPYQFNYGSLVSSSDMHGGAWESTMYRHFAGNSLDNKEDRDNLFVRASHQIGDNIEVFGQYGWGRSQALTITSLQFNQGNIAVTTDNAFLPASVASQAQALGLTSLTIGTWNIDVPAIEADNDRTVQRGVLGIKGEFGALGSDWNWDAYVQAGRSRSHVTVPYITSRARMALARDAVLHPVSGQIVCRSSIANPSNGCVPYNSFGIGVNSQAALDYIGGTAVLDQDLEQEVAAATLRGEPFSIWAGPVSLAAGIEHRKESVEQESDPESRLNDHFAANYMPTDGDYDVNEAFIETVVPLATDKRWARNLDLNGAVRFTDYSSSGAVTTWKAGATYSPIDSLRFRVTRSRDIRAPTLVDLFSVGSPNNNIVLDPFRGGVATQYSQFTVGNLALEPERADTTGIGFVVQPTFMPGFSTSVDYFEIDIADAIGSISAQQTLDLCFAGNELFCAQIERGSLGGTNAITRITIQPLNFVVEQSRGFDIEASYRTPFDRIVSGWPGEFSVRVLGSHNIERTINSGVVGSIPTDAAGTVILPDWRWLGIISYANNPLEFALGARGVTSSVYSNEFVECTSGCPVSTANNPTINDNDVDGAYYLDASVSYQFLTSDDGGGDLEAFINVRNLLDRDPEIVAPGPGSVPAYQLLSNCTTFDCNGRVVRAGVRYSY